MSVCVFHAQDLSGQQAVLVTVFLVLAVFMVLYVLVYAECLVRRWLRASALLIWACLVTLGYALVFDAWTKAACVWEQVRGRAPAPLGDGCRSSLCRLWAPGPRRGPMDQHWGVGPGPACSQAVLL